MKCTRNGVQCAHRRPVHNCSKWSVTICNYMIDTGEKRGCPAGAKCTRYTPKKEKEKSQ